MILYNANPRGLRLCQLFVNYMYDLNVGYFGHGRFGHGHFGQDISATDISAIKNAKGGRFGQNHKFMYFCLYMGD